MKKIFVLVAVFSTLVINSSTAHETQKTQPREVLAIYYDIKDALVAGNAATAAAKASDFIGVLGNLDAGIINEKRRNALLKEATAIATNKDLSDQRIRFSTFSDNMIALVKEVKLTTESVYEQYCPMKKASWLSGQSAIRNPYYGSAMLACGKINATL